MATVLPLAAAIRSVAYILLSISVAMGNVKDQAKLVWQAAGEVVAPSSLTNTIFPYCLALSIITTLPVAEEAEQMCGAIRRARQPTVKT